MTNRQIVPEGVTPVDELRFTALEPRYIRAIFFSILLSYLLLMGLGLLFLTGDLEHPVLVTVITECVLGAACMVNLCLIRHIYAVRGYALREHDITYRKGIFFPKLTTVPYARIQQVSVRQNPLTRALGLYALDIVSGAQGAALTVPGLSEDVAQNIKSLLIQKSNHGDR